MKESIKRLLVIIFFLLFGLCPNIVNAAMYSSDFINISGTYNISNGEDLSIENIYFKKDIKTMGGQTYYGVLYGKMINLTNYYLSAHMTIDYYDENYRIVASSIKEEQPGLATDNYMMNIMLNDKDFVEQKDIDDVKYFKVNYYTIKKGLLSNPSVNDSNIYDNNADYILKSYDINILVNENNTLEITEQIGAYFNVRKHGIFRKIPLKNTVTRLDGTISKNRAKISDINVSDEYSLYNENGYKVIKIGNPNLTLTGQKDYTIKYVYNLGRDIRKEYDELYFNLIGNEWDTSIYNVTFTIQMPKEFDKEKLGFSSGVKGSTDSSNITYNVDGNTITGRLNRKLNEGEALTVRLELPEGYFVGATNNFDSIMIAAFLWPILFVIISYLLWRKYGKDEPVVETVEFYPPQGLNSLDVGFLYKGKADSHDVISLLIYLANKGYIKISDYEEKSLFSKTKGFKLTKLKEYDGNNINEQLFLTGLFKSQRSLYLFGKNKEESPSNEVTSSDLYDTFYITLRKILADTNKKKNINQIFEKGSYSKKIFISLMIIATYGLITIPPFLAYGDLADLMNSLIFTGIGFTFMFKMFFSETHTVHSNGKSSRFSIVNIIAGLIVGGVFGGIPWFFSVLPVLQQDYIYLSIYIVGILCIMGMVICFNYLPKRNPYGNEMLGKLRGFRNFLEVAEKDQLEAQVMQNPTYFYDILPYTYVLGVSDKWIKKFESIALQAPDWYDGHDSFNVRTFETFMNNTMTSAQRTMSSSPSSGGSGGGSSGGGSGGGGGGSW